MMPFESLPSVYQTLIESIILILELLQIGYLQMLIRHRKIKQFLLWLPLAIGSFLAMNALAVNTAGEKNFMGAMPVPIIVLLIAAASVLCSVLFARESRIEKHLIGDRSIRDAFDNLPSGICFFDEKGALLLCNSQMHRLAFSLMGQDLQQETELREALKSPAGNTVLIRDDGKSYYLLGDESLWSFSETRVELDGAYYREFIASDMTQLYQLQMELKVRSESLQEMINSVRRVSENIQDITRQQEILAAKMRVHNKMGNCLLAAKQFIARGFPKDKKAEVLDLWEQSLGALREELGAKDAEDPFDEIKRIAVKLGLELKIEGDLPEDPGVSGILQSALRECITNAIRHAYARELRLQLSQKGGELEAVFTNNGVQPLETIKEGGGLSSLREKVEESGGSMSIQSFPEFELKLVLPTVIERI